MSALAGIGTPCLLLAAYIQAKLITATWTPAQSGWAAALVAEVVMALGGGWFFFARRRYGWSWTSVATGAVLFLAMAVGFESV